MSSSLLQSCAWEFVPAIHTGDGEPCALASVWEDLKNERCKIVDSFSSGERCYLILRNVTRSGRRTRPAGAFTRSTAILEQLLLSGSHKRVAFDVGMSVSNVATAAKRALAQWGFRGKPSRAPVLLVMAAHAAHGAIMAFDARQHQVSPGGESDRVVSIRRPERVLAARLTEAEFAVLGRLLDGKSHAEIAHARGASIRTVANQLANSFRRLGVSGRGALLVWLAHGTPERASVSRFSPQAHPAKFTWLDGPNKTAGDRPWQKDGEICGPHPAGDRESLGACNSSAL